MMACAVCHSNLKTAYRFCTYFHFTLYLLYSMCYVGYGSIMIDVKTENAYKQNI